MFMAGTLPDKHNRCQPTFRGRSLKLAALVALADPPDLLVRFLGALLSAGHTALGVLLAAAGLLRLIGLAGMGLAIGRAGFGRAAAEVELSCGGVAGPAGGHGGGCGL